MTAEPRVQPSPKPAAAARRAWMDQQDALRESRDWWKSEWEHKSREADQLWLACLVLGVLCGVAFFVGTVVG